MSDLRITEAFLYMDYLRMSECIQISFAVCRIGIYTCFRALCCKGPPPPRPEYDLVCIGLSGAGKTSLLSKLCGESPENVVSTTGAANIRKYWSRYYQGSQGVIFVLDSASSEEELETSRKELHSALHHPQLCTLPFLILANHQDKPAARSVQELFSDMMDSVIPFEFFLAKRLELFPIFPCHFTGDKGTMINPRSSIQKDLNSNPV
ncbi:ADP-ribosylation factor-like protein 15 isoform X5 [Macrotis lagotis]|uniref:ADP-ribosylation factor-like protein 15 isoform X5 n=1 Tax=Macrotis lagotis TaxID=92651 RepID=UPI003D68F558